MKTETDIASTDGQKRWTAVLFADLENFTTISERIGAEQAYDLMKQIVRAACDKVESHDGFPIEYAGDSVLAAFGAPVAVENASLNACRAAYALHDFMRDSAPDFLARFGIEPRFRIGIAGGVVVVGKFGMDVKMDLSLLGEPVNLASRIQNMAGPGEILCSKSINDEVEGFIATESLGSKAVKGLSKPQEIFALKAQAPERSILEGRMARGAKRFVGRVPELTRLRNWSETATGSGGIIDLSGPAGIGKSRLIHEAISDAAHQKRLIVVHCNSNLSRTPLAPLKDLIRSAIDVDAEAPREAVAKRLESLLEGEDPAIETLLDLLGDQGDDARGVSPDMAVFMRDLVGQLVWKIGRDPRNIVVIEDIHWMDTVSEDVLASVVALHSAETRILFSRRNEIDKPWLEAKGVTRIALEPLGEDNVRNMIAGLLGCDDITDDVLSHILGATEGNSLFVEETVRYLLQSGQVQVRGGATRLALRPGEQATQGNIQHLVLSRFDKLDEDTRTQLMIAATRGRQFTTDFLTACWNDAGETQAALAAAQAAGLITPVPPGQTDTWHFSHALIGKAIEESALATDRRRIHATIARVLDTSGNNDPFNFAEELAFHYEAAGNLGKAVFYLWKSAEKAMSVYALVQADAFLDQAFDLIAQDAGLVDDAEFAKMLVLWGRTLDIYGNFKKLNEAMVAHLPRVKASGPSKELSICQTMQAMSRSHAGHYQLGMDLANEALGVAQEIGDEHSVVWAKASMAVINLYSGFAGPDAVIAQYEEFADSPHLARDPHLMTLAHYTLAAAHRYRGHHMKSLGVIDALSDYGRERADARALSFSANSRCLLHMQRDDLDELGEALKDALRFSVPDTGAWRVAKQLQLIRDHGKEREGTIPDDFLPHRDRAKEFDDLSMYIGCVLHYSQSSMRFGRIDEGWKAFLEIEKIGFGVGFAEFRHVLPLVRARYLLAVAGLTPGRPSRGKPGLKDVLRLVRLRLTAVREAERSLDKFFASTISTDGYMLGLGHLFRAYTAKKRGNATMARENLDIAERFFEDQNALIRIAETQDLRATL